MTRTRGLLKGHEEAGGGDGARADQAWRWRLKRCTKNAKAFHDKCENTLLSLLIEVKTPAIDNWNEV
ncbi:hypothetical protein ABLO16_19315, partial [Mycobacterium tuberculosis]